MRTVTSPPLSPPTAALNSLNANTNTSSSNVPGCNQTPWIPNFFASSSTFSVTLYGVIMRRRFRLGGGERRGSGAWRRIGVLKRSVGWVGFDFRGGEIYGGGGDTAVGVPGEYWVGLASAVRRGKGQRRREGREVLLWPNLVGSKMRQRLRSTARRRRRVLLLLLPFCLFLSPCLWEFN